MIKLIFEQADGSTTLVEAGAGTSVMEAAVANNISGVIAECGGACACATCHVYIPVTKAGKFGKPDAMERDMLEFAMNPSDTSRLACQVIVTEEMDSIVIKVPEIQC